MGAWTTFLAVQAGASASLLGLVLVALSVSFAKIIDSPHLPNRAAEGLAVLVLNMAVAMNLLIPGQGIAPQGVETLGLVALAWGLVSCLHLHSLRRVEAEHRGHAVVDVVFGQALLTLWAASAVMLMFQGEAGLRLMGHAFLLGYIFTLFQVWVLLVEINR